MPQDLAQLSGRPKVKEYAQGRARAAIGQFAEFLAPTVEVSRYTGKYSKYDEKTRFKIPETLRSLGGDATRLQFAKTDQDFNCDPHALDTPLDNIEIEESEGEDLLMEAADESAALGGMSHEARVIQMALDNLDVTGGVGAWSGASNPVTELNNLIKEVYLAAGGYPTIEVGIALDPTALITFFDNDDVKSYFPGADSIAPNIENLKRLLIGKTNVQTSWLAIDTAAEGKDLDMEFKLNSTVLVFARSSSPTRRDPSFMKTFRPRGRWMVPGTYDKQDGRGKVVKMDWAEDVVIANAIAAKRITIS